VEQVKCAEKPLTVLLVEDDQDDCHVFERLIDSMEDISLIGVTNNEDKALEYAKDHLPDAVILDLELHRGSGNGVAFLEALSEMHMKLFPYILVTTHNVSRITLNRARQLGADFIMVKSQEDYSVWNVIEFLQSLKKTIQDLRKKMWGKDELAEASPFDLKKRQEARITVEIDRIGISPKALGREYLIDAIILRIEGCSNQVAAVARKYGKTDASVERAMQNAINKAWSTTHPDDLSMYYTSRIHSEKGVPTVMEFICYYANIIKAEYKHILRSDEK